MSPRTPTERLTRLAACLLLCGMTTSAGAQQPRENAAGSRPPDRIEKRTYEFKEAGKEMEYALFVPSGYDKGKKAPLIVALHGLGGNPQQMIRSRGLTELAEKYGYIVVAPMGYNSSGWYGALGPGAGFGAPGRGFGTPPGTVLSPRVQETLKLTDEQKKKVEELQKEVDAGVQKILTEEQTRQLKDLKGNAGRGFAGGFGGGPDAPKNLGELSEKDVMNVLELVRKEFRIDDGRIYLIGHSMGGGGTWHLGTKYPEVWAGLAPIAPAAFGQPTGLDKLKNVPVIVVQGAEDTLVRPEGTRRWVEKLKELNVPHDYLEIAGAGHGDVVAKGMPKVFEFFEKQKKGGKADGSPTPPPGSDGRRNGVDRGPQEKTPPAVDQRGPTIKEVSRGHFLIGTAGDLPGNYSDEELGLVKGNFSVVTPENCMKPAAVHPGEDTWRFEQADALVKWCTDNNLAVHGHTLVWHAQTGNWFFRDGDRAAVTRRLKDHISTLVGRYKGKVRSWDVVNEAINDGGTDQTARRENLRNSSWLRALGPDFIPLAFELAHEADPDARLYYNDYGIEAGAKHESSMVLLRRLITDGVPVHGVGIQGHWSTDSVPYAALDRAIADYASLGLKVSISELDVTIRGASGGQFGRGRGFGGRRMDEGPPPSPKDLEAQADAYARLFAIFIKHKDVVERVTFWGISDRRTWRFGQHPLIFDSRNQRKPAYGAIVDALLHPSPDRAAPR